MTAQLELANSITPGPASLRLVSRPFRTQLLKWIGNKQRYAHEIIGFFPDEFDRYIEPFVGSGAVLATLAPKQAIASDALRPLIELWQAVVDRPADVAEWYKSRWDRMAAVGKTAAFEVVRASYNANPNAADLLFISRSCYGGVLRFRQRDGAISTPCGAHAPVSPASFERRLNIWRQRIGRTHFIHSDFEPVMDRAVAGDLVYCDPPYSHSQSILYGAQSFNLSRLMSAIDRCKRRGVSVVLSIDGMKRSGRFLCDVEIPEGLFEREAAVNCGGSMLKRFQMKGESIEGEQVRDRLLLTY
jgi:DNA adenine methylase